MALSSVLKETFRAEEPSPPVGVQEELISTGSVLQVSDEDEEDTFSIDSLQVDAGIKEVPNEPSIDQRSAYVASVTEDPATTFNTVQSEYKATGESPTEAEILRNMSTASRLDVQEQLVAVIKDPTISDKEKLELIDEFGFTGSNNNPRFLASEAMAIQADVTVNGESERVNSDNINMLDGYDRQQRDQWEQQQRFLISHADPSVVANTIDFFQTMVPFLENFITAGIFSDFQEALGQEATPIKNFFKNIFFQRGTQKQQIIDGLRAVPLASRPEMVSSLLKIVKQRTSSALLDDNDFLRITLSNEYLTEGDYTSTAKFIDNAAGLLDLVFVGTVLKRSKVLSKRLIGADAEPVVVTDPTDVAGVPLTTTERAIAGRPVDLGDVDIPVGDIRAVEDADISALAGAQRRPTPRTPAQEIVDTKKAIDDKKLLDIERDLSSRTQVRITDQAVRAGRTQIRKFDKELDGLRDARRTAKGKALQAIEDKIKDIRKQTALIEKRLKLNDQAKKAAKDLAKIKAARGVTEGPSKEQLKGRRIALNIRAKFLKDEFDDPATTTARQKEIQKEVDKLKSEVKAADKAIADAKKPSKPGKVDKSKLPKWVQQELDEAVVVPMDEVVSDMTNSVIRSDGNPASLMRMAEIHDPAKARALHAGMANALADAQLSRPISGTDIPTALADNVMPSPTEVTGLTSAGRSLLDEVVRAGLDVDPEIAAIFGRISGLPYAQGTKGATKIRVTSDFESATGITTIADTVKIGHDNGGSFVVEGVYAANRDSGFINAMDAIETTQLALRKYGIRDDEVQLLTKAGNGQFIKVTGNPATLQDGEYLTKVVHKYDLSPADIMKGDEQGEILSSNWSFFDRFWPFPGSVGPDKFIFGPASKLAERIRQGGIEVEQRTATLTKILLDKTNTFRKNTRKLSKTRRNVLMGELRRANQEEINLLADINAQRANGFNAEEIQLIRDWKQIWDSHFFLENTIAVANKRKLGFELVESSDGSTRLFARPQTDPRQVPEGIKVYNPSTDEVTTLGRDAINEIYTAKGTVSKLDYPLVRDELRGIEHIIVDNSSGKFFGRKIRESDWLLRYRQGYYSIRYDTPFFIQREVTDAAGNFLYTKTVQMAGTIKDATLAARRLNNTSDEGFLHEVVPARGKESMLESSEYYDAQVAGGRTTHRVRGEELFRVIGRSDAEDSFVVDPIRSAVQSARSVSNSVSTRLWVEPMKTRFIDEFSDLMPTVDGITQWPKSLRDIKQGAVGNEKRFRTARSMYDYINYMEFTNIASIDDIYMASMRGLADIAGNASVKALDDTNLSVSKGYEAAEIALRVAGGIRPTAFARNLAFQVLISLNPLRQFVINTHQSVNSLALDPAYTVGRLAPDSSSLYLRTLAEKTTGGKSRIFAKSAKSLNDDVEQMWKDWQQSGIPQSVTHSELMEGSFNQLGDFLAHKAPDLGKFLSLPKRLGFDAGEYALLQNSWLVMRSRAIKADKDITDIDVLAGIASDAREFSLSSSKATSFQYNQGITGMFLQFLSTPQRALLQMTTSKLLTKSEKLQMGVQNIVMYGVPTTFIGSMSGLLEDEDISDDTRNGILFGLESLMVNSLMELFVDEDVDLDLGPSFDAADMGGLYKLIHGVLTTTWSEQLTNTPSVGLFAGHNPRITDFLKETASIFTVDPEQRPEQAKQAAVALAGVSGLFSNAFKAAYAMEKGRKISATGQVTDPDVSTPEAIFGLFTGIGTATETRRNIFNDEIFKDYGTSSAFERDVLAWNSEQARAYTRRGIDRESRAFSVGIFREAFHAFDLNRPRALEILRSQLNRNTEGFTQKFYSSIINQTGIKSPSQVANLINISPLSPQVKNSLREEQAQLRRFVDTENAKAGVQ